MGNGKFNDTDNKNIIYAKVLDILYGVGDSCFNPNAKISREEVATLLYRLAKYSHLELNYTNHSFKDNKNISPWAKKAVAFISHYEIMKGINNDTFNSKGICTREQAYITIYCLFNL